MAAEEIHLKKINQGFFPATEQDQEACRLYKVGDTIRFKAQKPRNGAHHRKGFALLQLGFSYWEPPTEPLTAGERHMAQIIADRLDAMGGGSGVIVEQVALIAKEVADNRLLRIGELEKSFDAFRKDVTIRAGFYDLEMSPSGLQKKARSLSFGSMAQEDFNAWYKAVFSVIWNLVLVRHFETEEQMENAVNSMLEYL